MLAEPCYGEGYYLGDRLRYHWADDEVGAWTTMRW